MSAFARFAETVRVRLGASLGRSAMSAQRVIGDNIAVRRRSQRRQRCGGAAIDQELGLLHLDWSFHCAKSLSQTFAKERDDFVPGLHGWLIALIDQVLRNNAVWVGYVFAKE